MPRNFADRLLDEIDAKQNPSCGGLDPVVAEIPDHLKKEVLRDYHDQLTTTNNTKNVLLEATAEALVRFNKSIIDATHDILPVFKPQIAFYECYGPAGLRAYWRTIDYARESGALVIGDIKREDIDNTAAAYAKGFLGTVELLDGSTTSVFNLDAATLGPYLGSDSVGQFIKVCGEYGKGAFVLVKTSNPSSGELQDMRFDDVNGGRLLFEQMALLVDQWGSPLKGDRGYCSLGAVVGATYPEQALRCREMMENAFILVPGYGKQGGAGRDTLPNFNKDGYGAVVNNSRGFIFAYKNEPYRTKFGSERFAEAAREAALVMRDDITGAMRATGKLPSKW